MLDGIFCCLFKPHEIARITPIRSLFHLSCFFENSFVVGIFDVVMNKLFLLIHSIKKLFGFVSILHNFIISFFESNKSYKLLIALIVLFTGVNIGVISKEIELEVIF